MRYFEDFHEGDAIDLGSYLVTAKEIVEFATEFDPAPFHLDEDAGRRSMLGGLAASGWHTCAIAMRMMCDSFLLQSAGQGAPGIETTRWLRPVLAGATLTGRALVQSARLSRSRPGIGLVAFRFEFFADGDSPAMTIENSIMFATRAQAEASA